MENKEFKRPMRKPARRKVCNFCVKNRNTSITKTLLNLKSTWQKAAKFFPVV